MVQIVPIQCGGQYLSDLSVVDKLIFLPYQMLDAKCKIHLSAQFELLSAVVDIAYTAGASEHTLLIVQESNHIETN